MFSTRYPRSYRWVRAAFASAAAGALAACGADGSGSDPTGSDAGVGRGSSDGSSAVGEAGLDAALGAADADEGLVADAARDASTGCLSPEGGSGAGCYALACAGTTSRSLSENRDRLVADLAKRKCTDRCALWAALSQAERYIFLMDTAYLGDATSRVYPPGASNVETALDHAVALYSINAPDGSTLGGQDYNRIYLGFDALATCVMRSFATANPAHTVGYNQWLKSDDVAGPHGPFTQREMIYWYKAFYDLQSEGPQFHHWAKDSDFDQSGLNQRAGVCGVTDRSMTELTIAFDTFHNSDPLGDYAGRGGTGSQIVDQHVTVPANFSYTPTGCAVTAPVNTDPYGGNTFAGRGPVLINGACTSPTLGDGGC